MDSEATKQTGVRGHSRDELSAERLTARYCDNFHKVDSTIGRVLYCVEPNMWDITTNTCSIECRAMRTNYQQEATQKSCPGQQLASLLVVRPASGQRKSHQWTAGGDGDKRRGRAFACQTIEFNIAPQLPCVNCDCAASAELVAMYSLQNRRGKHGRQTRTNSSSL